MSVWLHRSYDLYCGGGSVAIRNMVEAFPHHRHVLVVNNLRRSYVTDYFNSQPNVELHVVKGRDFRPILDASKPDVVFFHYFPPMSARDFRNIPAEVRQRSLLYNHWFKPVPRVADLAGYIFVSPDSHTFTGWRLSPSDCLVTYNPIAPPFFQIQRAPGPFSIGRHSRAAGLKFSRDFFSLYEGINLDNLQVRILGCPERIVQHLNTEGIRLRHTYWALPFNTMEVARFLSHVDVFVYKTAQRCRETGSIAIMEALAAGIPVVCENKGSMKNQVIHGETGFLCDDLQDFADAVELLAQDDKLRRQFSDRARQWAWENTSTNVFCQRLEDFISRSLGPQTGSDFAAPVNTSRYALTSGSPVGDTKEPWASAQRLICETQESAVDQNWCETTAPLMLSSRSQLPKLWNWLDLTGEGVVVGPGNPKLLDSIHRSWRGSKLFSSPETSNGAASAGRNDHSFVAMVDQGSTPHFVNASLGELQSPGNQHRFDFVHFGNGCPNDEDQTWDQWLNLVRPNGMMSGQLPRSSDAEHDRKRLGLAERWARRRQLSIHAYGGRIHYSWMIRRAANNPGPSDVDCAQSSRVGNGALSSEPSAGCYLSAEDLCRLTDNVLARPGHRWLFLLGINPSGCVFLAHRLAFHPDIRILPGEGHALTTGLPQPWEYGVSGQWTNRLDAFRWTEQRDGAPAVRALIDWARHVRGPARTTIDLSPPNCVRAPWLARHFARCKLIAVVRHPLGYCAELKRRRFDLVSAARHWALAYGVLSQDVPTLPNSLVIKLEDFCQDFRGSLERIADLLALPDRFTDEQFLKRVEQDKTEQRLRQMLRRQASDMKRLTSQDIETVSDIVGEVACRFDIDLKRSVEV